MHDLDTIVRLNSRTTQITRPYTGIAVKEDGTPFLVRCDAAGWIQDAKHILHPLARAVGGRLIAAIPGYREERILATWVPDFN